MNNPTSWFDAQRQGKRFFLVSVEDATIAGLEFDASWNAFSLVLEYADGNIRVVGCDGGEPEDQTLCRDWSWVVEELNAAYEEGRVTEANSP